MTGPPFAPRGLGPGPFIISIQSQVVHGAVGFGAALFPMLALGLRVAAVPTTLLSNHPRYPTLRGGPLDARLLADLLKGVEERGLIEAAAVLHTGYLGSAAIGGIVAEFVARARRQNPRLIYLCDPVIGDDGPGVFVEAGLIDIFRDRLVPQAQILTPNQFELECLAQMPARTLDQLAAAARLATAGPRAIVVTGATLADAPADVIETIVCEDGALERIAAKRAPIAPNGAGDLFAGLLCAHLAHGAPLALAARRAVSAVSRVLERTLRENSYELRVTLDDILPERGA